MKSQIFPQKYWAMLFTLAVLALALLFYVFIYAEQNKAKLNANCYEELNTITRELNERLETFRSNASYSAQMAADSCYNMDPSTLPNKSLVSEIISEHLGAKNPDLMYVGYYRDSYSAKEAYAKGPDFITFSVRLKDKSKIENKRYLKRKLWRTQMEQGEGNSFFRHDTLSFVFKTNTEKLLNRFFKKSVFDDFIFVHNGNIHSSALSGMHVSFPDTVAELQPIAIGGKNYYVYNTVIPESNVGGEIKLSGLVSVKKFNSLQYRFNSWFFFLVSAVLIILTLTFPIFKIVTLSSVEELNKNDSVMSALAVCLGASVTILLLMSIYSRSGLGDDSTDRKLMQISKDIKERFVGDLTHASRQLNKLDSLYYAQGTSVGYSENGYSKPNLLAKDFMQDAVFKRMKIAFWLDEDGNQVAGHTIFPEESKLINLSHRNYFKDVVDNKLWMLTKNDTLTLESIRSVTSGECLAAISKRSFARGGALKNLADSVKPKAVVLTAQLNSVINSVVPYGMEFCLIDENGLVWFHSDKEFNLQENFFEKIADSRNLKASVKTNTSDYFSTQYHYEDYMGYIDPIENTPLYLITLHKKEILNNSNSQIFAIAFLLVLAVTAVFLMHLLVLLVFNSNKKRFYNHPEVFSWLKFNQHSGALYSQALVGNIASALLFLILNYAFFKLSRFSSLELCFSSMIITPIVTFAFNYYIIAKNHARVYPFKIKGKKIVLPSKLAFLVFSIGSALVISLALITVLNSESGYVPVLYLFLLTSAWVFILKTKKGEKAVASKNGYFLFMYSMVVLFAVLPSLAAFKISYDTENIICARQEMFETAGKYKIRNDEVESYYKQTSFGASDKETELRRTTELGVYAILQLNEDIEHFRGKSESNQLNDLYGKYSPRLGKNSKENKKFLLTQATDSSWHSHRNKKTIHFTRQFSSLPEKKISLSKHINTFNLASVFNGGSWFILAFAVLFVLSLYFLTKLITSKIFGIDLQAKRPLNAPDEPIDFTKKEYKYIIGLSGAEKFREYPDKEKCFVLDFEKLHELDDWKEAKHWSKSTRKSAVLVNFDFDLYSKEAWSNKLDIVKLLYTHSTRGIYITTQLHPHDMYDLYKRFGESTTDENEKLRLKAEEYEWKQLLKYFVLKHVALTSDCINKKFEVNFGSGIIKQEVNRFSSNEITEYKIVGNPVDVYLPELCCPVKANDWDSRESQNLLYNYFNSLWKSIPMREKYVLYDFAKDGYINTKHLEAIDSLMKKGLLVDNGSICIINEDFRLFILSILNPEDEFKRAEEIKQNGRWNSFRMVLLVVILALFVFVWFGNQEILSDFKAILTSVTAISTLLISFSSILNKKRI